MPRGARPDAPPGRPRAAPPPTRRRNRRWAPQQAPFSAAGVFGGARGARGGKPLAYGAPRLSRGPSLPLGRRPCLVDVLRARKAVYSLRICRPCALKEGSTRCSIWHARHDALIRSRLRSVARDRRPLERQSDGAAQPTPLTRLVAVLGGAVAAGRGSGWSSARPCSTSRRATMSRWSPPAPTARHPSAARRTTCCRWSSRRSRCPSATIRTKEKKRCRENAVGLREYIKHRHIHCPAVRSTNTARDACAQSSCLHHGRAEPVVVATGKASDSEPDSERGRPPDEPFCSCTSCG